MANFNIGNNTRAANNGGNSGFTNNGTETVAVRIKSVHVADPKNPSYENDYFIGTLLHNGLGFDVDGSRDLDTYVSTTEVKVFLRAPRSKPNANAEHTPYVVNDFRKLMTKGSGKPMGANPVAILERAYVDSKTGNISAGWLKCGMHDSPENVYAEGALKDAVEYVHPAAHVVVYPEREKKGADGKPKLRTDGSKEMRQDRVMYLTEFAQLVGSVPAVEASEGVEAQPAKTSLQAFIDNTAIWLQNQSDNAGGMAHVHLRIISVNDASAFQEVKIYPKWDATTETNVDPRTVIEQFLEEQYAADPSKEKNGNWKAFIENADTLAVPALDEETGEVGPGYAIEMCPVWTFRTGAKSMPSAKKKSVADHENNRNFVVDSDGQQQFRTDKDGALVPEQAYMIGRAHLKITRKLTPDGMTIWSAVETSPVKGPRTEYHEFSDLPMMSTPAPAAERFMALAARRLELREATRQPMNSAQAPAADAAPEEGVSDPSNGLSAGGFNIA